MNIKNLSSNRSLKVMLFILLGVALLALITNMILGGIKNNKRYARERMQNESFLEMLDYLEFNDIDDQFRSLVDKYTGSYDNSTNVIVTRENGEVVFSLNDAYMPHKERFTAVVKNRNNYYTPDVYILDAENKIRYAMRLRSSYNVFKLNDISEYLQGPSATDSDELADFEKQLRRGDNVRDMNYAYIGSKGWNVFSIYKDNIDYYWYSYRTTGWYYWQEGLNKIGTASFVFFWLLLPIWVFRDARRRSFRPALWGILVLVTNLVGLIVYLLSRPELAVCKNCGKQLESGYISCPYCGVKNREICDNCNNIMEETWVACPYCGSARGTVQIPEES
jgi:RNA polymerase subunit RPABC4/transcription elongation factor Spt4